MKTLSESRVLRFVILCVLYIAQGIPFGFITVALAAYIAKKGGDAKQVGTIVAVSVLPWSFKWVWGLVIDRFTYPAMGHRRPWILFAQFLKAITIALMIFSSDAMTNLTYLGIMIFIHNMCSSLQDVSTDALAVDILHEKERGKANGLMRGSSYLGTSIGAVGAGWVLTNYGFQASLIFQALVLFGIGLFPLFLRERPGEKLLPWTKGAASRRNELTQIRSTWELLKDLRKAFSIRTTLMAVGLTIWVNIGVSLLAVVGLVMLLQNYGWTEGEWQRVQGIYVIGVGLGASVLGGYISDIYSPRKTIFACILLLGISWILFSLCHPWWHVKPFIIAFTIWEQFLIAFFTVSIFALCMSVTWSVVAGTQFTAYMAMLNLSTTIGSKLAGWLEGVSYPKIYVIAGIVQIFSLLFLLFINPKQSQKVFGSVGETDEEIVQSPS